MVSYAVAEEEDGVRLEEVEDVVDEVLLGGGGGVVDADVAEAGEVHLREHDELLLRVPLLGHGVGQQLVVDLEDVAEGRLELLVVEGQLEGRLAAVRGRDDRGVLVETLPRLEDEWWQISLRRDLKNF